MALSANKITAGDTGRINQINDIIDDLEDLEDRKVEVTGDETIAGKKTFSTIPETSGGNPTTDNQLVRKAWIQDPEYEVFTANGTWTKPAGVRLIEVEVVGGGGGGGGSRCTSMVASGGGAGGYSKKIIDVSAIGSVTVTIGAGGTGGSYDSGYSYTEATAGGTSSFGAHCSATGGAIGVPGDQPGGGGGGGSGGDVNLSGDRGGMSRQGTYQTSQVCPFSGLGGLSILKGYGSGGDGGQSAYSCPSRVAGSNGVAGVVIVKVLR
jgi:hypothetical protein